MRFLCVTAICVIGLCLAASQLFAVGTMTGKAGKFSVEIASQHNPPVIGDNPLTLTIKEGNKPLTGAGVNVHLDMVGMSMPADVAATPGKTDGEYLATANLSMAGKWKIAVTVKQMADMHMDGDGKANFEMTVPEAGGTTPVAVPAGALPAAPIHSSSQPPWNWLGIGLLIIIVAVIIIAVSQRRKDQ